VYISPPKEKVLQGLAYFAIRTVSTFVHI